jgi:hypothetical protein
MTSANLLNQLLLPVSQYCNLTESFDLINQCVFVPFNRIFQLLQAKLNPFN